MRVWLVPSRFAPHVGGIETVVSELAHQLQRVGVDVLVITHRHPETLPADEIVDAVRVRRVRFEAPSRRPTAVATFLRSLPSVTQALDAEMRPDVIHVHGAANQLFPITRYARRRGIPVIVTTHGEITGDANDIYGRSRYIRSSLRYGVKHSAAVSAPSRGPLADLSRLACSPRSLERVIPNGVRISDWASGVPTPASKMVLAWGRLEWQKGFDRLLAAWPLVRERVTDARLLIAGDGAERSALEAMVTPGASLLGSLDRPDLAVRLRDAQLAAVPSRVEAFGMSALEALAGGRPVLHSGLPALQELVGSNGWSVPHDDPSTLARAMVDALEAQPRQVSAEETAHLDWAKVLDGYRALYTEAAR